MGDVRLQLFDGSINNCRLERPRPEIYILVIECFDAPRSDTTRLWSASLEPFLRSNIDEVVVLRSGRECQYDVLVAVKRMGFVTDH